MAGGVKAKKQKLESQSWADLPLDIACLIANRLCYTDQISFQAVCKRWRAAEIVRYADKLPWLMGYKSSSCYLYDPSHKRKYSVSISAKIREKFTDLEVEPLDSKQDWVLFKGDEIIMYGIHRFFFFFYTPFTDKMIELPEMRWSSSCTRFMNLTSFSTTPISPDCMIFTIWIISGNYCICFCSPGDEAWTQFWLDAEYGRVENVVYVDGFFYCFFRTRKAIGAFNVASKEWEILPHPPLNRADYYLIDSDGSMLSCDLCSEIGRFSPVFKFNRSRKEWYEVESLGDKTLFLGTTPRMVPVEKGSELANTMHLFDYHGRDIINEYIQNSSKSVPEVRDYENFKMEHLRKIWIQPPERRSVNLN